MGEASSADCLLVPLDDPVAAVMLGLKPAVCLLFGETVGSSGFVTGEAMQEVPVQPSFHPFISIFGTHGAQNHRSVPQGR